MDDAVFPDRGVRDQIDQHYVPVRIVAEDNEALMEQYRVPGLPTIVILDGNGKEITRLIGYQSVEALSQALEEAASKR